jgi:carbonic anhydrase/acetyltransferase-like protein (isoleucine patch superfamily)
LLIKHNGVSPRIDPTAWVAPNAVVCGDVTVGPGCRIMYGAQVIAEGGTISIGRECIVMENAVLRSTARHPLTVGNNCLVGPNAHVVGCTVEDEVFIATGAAVFHSARLGKGSEVRTPQDPCRRWRNRSHWLGRRWKPRADTATGRA